MKVYELLIEAFSPTMKNVLKELISIFEQNHINYVIGGANALSVYSKRPRMTVDIDAFVDNMQKDELDGLMLDHNFQLMYHQVSHSKFKKDGVEVDLLYSGNSAEKWSIDNSRDNKILGIDVRTASPEALLWLYLISSKDQNFVDAISLVKSVPHLNIKFVKQQVKNEPKLLEKLNSIISTVSRKEQYR